METTCGTIETSQNQDRYALRVSTYEDETYVGNSEHFLKDNMTTMLF